MEFGAAKKYKLPKVLKICGRRVKLRTRFGLKLNGETVYGYFDTGENSIWINTAKRDHVASTLLHEIIHAILFYSGQSQSLEETQEEGITVALEHALSDLLPVLYRAFRLPD